MCRSIRPLQNLAPPATDSEVDEAARQYVRKISGTARPSRANADAVEAAVAEVARSTRVLLDTLVTSAAPRDRTVEADKARARALLRDAR